VFRVSPPAAEREAEEESSSAEVFQEPARSSAPGRPAAEDTDRERLVLVADAEIEAGKAIAGTLIDAGLQPVLVHDGVEAILTIQRTLPRAVVLDAGLPKMFGFQICELMKRNQSLRQIQVVLIGAIHHRDRYRRAPSEIYGADAYLERHQVREKLLATLRGFGLPVARVAAERAAVPPPAPPRPPREAPRVTRPAPVPTSEARAQRAEVERSSLRPAAAPAAAPSADPGLAAEIARAERLARIIVSDVVLYNEDKLNAAIRAGNVSQSFESEMAEGRGHFAQRIDARVREMRDFLGEELLRVARARGMR
jgi:CheY-like chemotaxis protein